MRQMLSVEGIRDSEFVSGRCQRTSGLVFAVRRDCTIQPLARITMHDETACGDIDDPILDDTGAGV